MTRHVVLPVAVVLAALLGLAAPASAHGPQSLVHVTATVTGGETVVTAAVTYLDGDPNGSSAITAIATGDGQAVTIPMTKTGEPGTFAGRAKLPVGRWALAVHATGASTGTGRAEIDVRSVAVAAVDGSSSAIPGGATLAAGGAVLLLALIAVGAGLSRRRVRPAA